MPRLCSAERLSESMVDEIFQKGLHEYRNENGLVLSGGGAVGAYQAGVVKALAECGTQISMVSGASIGAFNGAIIAASPDLSEAAVRTEALWDHLGNNQVLSVNRLVYFSLLKNCSVQ